MQIKDYYLKHAPSFWKAAGVVVAGLALLLVYKRFAAEHTNLTAVVWPKSSFLTIGIVTALMLVNWSLEAWRWRISVRVFERVTFLQSLRTVLAGLALNWVLPLTSGDALSRVIERTDKYKAATAMVLNRAIMLLLTCLFGLVSVMYYSKASVEINLLLPSILMVMLVLFFLFRRYLGQFLSYFTQIRKRVLLGIVGISLLRYAVFVFQFFLLLQLFLPELSAPYLLLGIGWIFFFRSILPSIFGGFGVREASGLIFFSELDPAAVVFPIFIIWIINSAIPTVFGALSIWRLRVASDK